MYQQDGAATRSVAVKDCLARCMETTSFLVRLLRDALMIEVIAKDRPNCNEGLERVELPK